MDIIADFDDISVSAACRFADEACSDRKLVPDVRPAMWCSERLITRALEEGRVLS